MWAFLNNQLTSVTIPDGVADIGYQAFHRNPLTSIETGPNTRIETTRPFTFSE
jgi:hypothetical protein